MGSEPDSETSSTPKLPLFSMAPPHLLDHTEPSGTLTPPLQTSASVPFRWEEQPGKPRPCTDIILAPTHNTIGPNRCLELPPRLTMVDSSNITKTPSPTTVLDGPGEGGKSVFSSSSFRLTRQRRRSGQRQRQSSFDSSCSGSRSPYEQLLLGGKAEQQQQQQHKGSGGLFGSFRLKGSLNIKLKGTGGSKDGRGGCVISTSSSSSMETCFFEDSAAAAAAAGGGEKKGKRMRRNGSFSSLSHITRSHFWTAMYQGFKQVVPWKKKKSSKKESFAL